MELLEIIFFSIACWPFVIGLIAGGCLGAILSLLTTGEVNTEMSASLACIFGLVSTFLFTDKIIKTEENKDVEEDKVNDQ